MSENESERGSDPGPNPVTGARDVTDDQLPEDLRPDDDNPLAKGRDEDDDEDGGVNLADLDPDQP